MIFVTSHQFWKDRLPFSTILKIRRDVISYLSFTKIKDFYKSHKT